MLALWNHLSPNDSETPGESSVEFRPADDLWLKVAEATPEEATGTSAFCRDVVRHFLDVEELEDTE